MASLQEKPRRFSLATESEVFSEEVRQLKMILEMKISLKERSQIQDIVVCRLKTTVHKLSRLCYCSTSSDKQSLS